MLEIYLYSGEYSHKEYHPVGNFISGILDITVVKPFIESIIGTYLITGEKLTDFERGMQLVNAIVGAVTFGQGALALDLTRMAGKEIAVELLKIWAVDAISDTEESLTELAEEELAGIKKVDNKQSLDALGYADGKGIKAVKGEGGIKASIADVDAPKSTAGKPKVTKNKNLSGTTPKEVPEVEKVNSSQAVNKVSYNEEVPIKNLKDEGGSDVSDTRNINGQRTSRYRQLSDDEILQLLDDIEALEADSSVFRFNEGNQTGFLDSEGIINVRGDVLPDLNSNHPRDLMSPRAVLAHEYYGHKYYDDVFGVRNPLPGSWNDEFRASYNAALNAPNLSDMDRMYLMLDALERAKEAGVNITITDEIRRILYGY